ncbi:MAG: hypothetical protein QGH47_04050 [Candidatus Woesearchaeota archaeon]|jgi:hypothetical protein|nr:hypothetical protein [Candidatus Woesearchaeota archaeon]|tara:strand:+ start:179 stop:421 length:243 start_codon:yes stop_codon:yes gene_type:complete
MVSITLSVPEETRKLMKKHRQINWSGYLRKIIINKARALEELEKLKKEIGHNEEISTWAVRVIKGARAGNLNKLKKQGLL